ncbi:MAG: D-alanyl-D-alanine carboxypeptidase/D-alanyl-D-alanine-endopeptidase [Gemmatimonadetes bacterium]|nr:D-alanyl-D-alanine carboxypeptidase/D-alanyl-D-alanine-endopeptidase [Gemmatimonadota bacterium]
MTGIPFHRPARRLASGLLAVGLGLATAAGSLLAQPVGSSEGVGSRSAGAATSSPESVADLLDPVVKRRAGRVGVAVYSVDRKAPLYLHNADEALLPASNMKLYTTAAALARLGPDFRYTTSLYADGPIRSDGTLEGNLLLVGRGDPTLSGRFYADSAPYVFDLFAQALRERGIRRIAGDLIGDASYFEDEPVAPGWDAGNLLWWYGARVSALSFNDNVVVIEVRPGGAVGAPPRVAFVPRADGLMVVNRVRTVGTRGGRSIGIKRRPDLGGYEIWGRIPIDSRPLHYVVAVEDPPAFALSVLRARLESSGIRIDGAERVVHSRTRLPRRPWQLVASHTGPRLVEIVRVINKRSQNFFAEQVLKTLGRMFEGDGSFADGRKVVVSVLRELGVPARELWVDDGSGLSRYDRATARTTAQLLVAIRDQDWFEAYYQSLLEAGRDGDPRRLDDAAAVGNVRTKTGTLRGVSALSGYVTTRDGELLAFSVITNGVPGGKGASISIEDAVAERLARYTVWHPPLLERDTGR